jgi:hypothetical protein
MATDIIQYDYGLSKDIPILHASGGLSSQNSWRDTVNRFFDDSRLLNMASPRRDDLTIVLISTWGTPTLMERCLAHLGVRDHVVLGAGIRTWDWALKVTLVRDYLGTGTSRRTEYVMYLDAGDVLLLTDPSVLVERFAAYDAELVFMGESVAYPWGYPALEEKERAIAARENCLPFFGFLNSGALIGRRDYLQGVLEDIDLSDDAYYRPKFGWDSPSEREDGKVFCDQLMWRNLYCSRYPEIKLDYNADMFIRFDTRMIAHLTDAAKAEELRPDDEITWW